MTQRKIRDDGKDLRYAFTHAGDINVLRALNLVPQELMNSVGLVRFEMDAAQDFLTGNPIVQTFRQRPIVRRIPFISAKGCDQVLSAFSELGRARAPTLADHGTRFRKGPMLCTKLAIQWFQRNTWNEDFANTFIRS